MLRQILATKYKLNQWLNKKYGWLLLFFLYLFIVLAFITDSSNQRRAIACNNQGGVPVYRTTKVYVDDTIRRGKAFGYDIFDYCDYEGKNKNI